MTYISLIEETRCCRPQNHPNDYEDCYDEDVTDSLNLNVLSECKKEGYYMAGFFRGSCNTFNCLDKLRCCKMKSGNNIY